MWPLDPRAGTEDGFAPVLPEGGPPVARAAGPGPEIRIVSVGGFSTPCRTLDQGLGSAATVCKVTYSGQVRFHVWPRLGTSFDLRMEASGLPLTPLGAFAEWYVLAYADRSGASPPICKSGRVPLGLEGKAAARVSGIPAPVGGEGLLLLSAAVRRFGRELAHIRGDMSNPFSAALYQAEAPASRTCV